MKPILSLFTALTLGITGINAQDAPQWNIDYSHSSVKFTATHFFSDVPGSFKEYSGEFYLDPENITEATMNFTVQVKSIDTDNKKRDNHLMSADFFNADKYPIIQFQSQRIEKTGENKYLVHGDLTIRDVTKKVALPMTFKGVMKHPMMKNTKIMGLSFNTTIDRTDYNVGTGDWAATAVVGDEVDVNIDLELNRKY